ncbi:MAG: pyrroline-5-carboxylate reductase [Proteobacteria bacterium]|nr:pyrroline-5-carboxylate reductase [Pseudomonadota bacterium]
MSTLDKTIGFIGAGNMAEAMIGALIASRTINSANVMACDISGEKLDVLKRSYNIRITPEAGILFSSSDIVILAVKPQVMGAVLDQLTSAPSFISKRKKLIISIAAGISLSRIEQVIYASLDQSSRALFPIIRVMPNTPSLVLEGMSGFCMNAFADEDDARMTRIILESMGRALPCTENQMDAITAVSGSGPAYFFYMVEAMVEAGTNLGLNPDDALTLSVQTMKGAAKLLEKSSDSPEALRKKVTSPGGTTEAALGFLRDAGFKDIVKKALAAAATRSKELSA